MEIYPDDDIRQFEVVVCSRRSEQQFLKGLPVPTYLSVLEGGRLFACHLLSVGHPEIPLQSEAQGWLFQEDAHLYLWLCLCGFCLTASRQCHRT